MNRKCLRSCAILPENTFSSTCTTIVKTLYKNEVQEVVDVITRASPTIAK